MQKEGPLNPSYKYKPLNFVQKMKIRMSQLSAAMMS